MWSRRSAPRAGRVRLHAEDHWTKNRSGGLPNAPPHYNGAPGQDYLIARSHPETKDTTLDLIRWGLLPSWAKDQKIAWKLINARAETVATASAFRKAFAKRRCLVPGDGFYEWKKVGKEKRPYLIAMADGEPFTFAGLWENWKDPSSGEWIRTFTIITTEANDLVRELHDRMPVVIGPDERDFWAAHERRLAAILASRRQWPLACMTCRATSRPSHVSDPWGILSCGAARCRIEVTGSWVTEERKLRVSNPSGISGEPQERISPLFSDEH